MEALTIFPSWTWMLWSFSLHQLSWAEESIGNWSTLDISFMSIIVYSISFLWDSSTSGFTTLLSQHLRFPCESFNHSSFYTHTRKKKERKWCLIFDLKTIVANFLLNFTSWSFLVRSANSFKSLGFSTGWQVHKEVLNFHQGFVLSVLTKVQNACMHLSMAFKTCLISMTSFSISCSKNPLRARK